MKTQILHVITCNDCNRDICYSFIDNPLPDKHFYPSKPLITQSEMNLCYNCATSYLIVYHHFMKFPWAEKLFKFIYSRRSNEAAGRSREWLTAINIARGIRKREEENEVSS